MLENQFLMVICFFLNAQSFRRGFVDGGANLPE
jgi:hypothetical protein